MPWGGKRWTAAELAELRCHARLIGPLFDLARLAMIFDCTRREVNQALDALLGRTPAEAAAWLNGRRERAGEPRDRVRAAVRRFIRELIA